MTLDDQAWDKACEDNNTANPTAKQVQLAYMELTNQIEDEAFKEE